jgi:large subunit ribosomal protein L19
MKNDGRRFPGQAMGENYLYWLDSDQIRSGRGSKFSGKLKVLNSTLYLRDAGEQESSRAMSIHPVMQRLADKLKRTDLPAFKAGDQIRVQVKIKEGDKERLQAFEGLVIAVKNGPQGSFTVRKMSFGQGVERIFPFNSKVVDKVEKIRSYRVRRAKLFYIRGLRGKAARMKEVARDKVSILVAWCCGRKWNGKRMCAGGSLSWRLGRRARLGLQGWMRWGAGRCLGRWLRPR